MTILDETEVDFWREVKASIDMIFGVPNPVPGTEAGRLEQANLELQQLARAQDIDAEGWQMEDGGVVRSPAGEVFDLLDSVGIRKRA